MTAEHRLKIALFIPRTEVLGPGTRAALWLQGCNRGCKGCIAESMKPLDGGESASVSQTAALILSVSGIEGVTISGGEPFLQAEALLALMELIKTGNPRLSVIVYTGYTLAQLRGLGNNAVNALLNGKIDVLIDGAYIEALDDNKAHRGSNNQQIIFLTGRYKDGSYYGDGGRKTDFVISGGRQFMIGVPSAYAKSLWNKV